MVARLIEARPGSTPEPDYARAIADAAAIIRRGGLVGFPTETVYGLAADALNETAVAKVYRVKSRPRDSALILHLAGAEQAADYVRNVPPVARRLMNDFWPGPLTLVLEKAPVVPAITAGGGDNIAVRVPAHRVALDLIAAAGRPVVGPSANRSGRPSPMTPSDVVAELGGDIDAVLDAGPAPLGMESTVLDLTVDPPAILRPGSVTAEELSGYFPALSHPRTEAEHGRPAGFGLPAVRLILLDLEPGPEAAARAWHVAMEALRAGGRPGLLLTEEGWTARSGAERGGPTGPGPVRRTAEGILVFTLGSCLDLSGIARRLYAGIRALEEGGCDLIVAEPVARRGLGAAVMDRLEKAASEIVPI